MAKLLIIPVLLLLTACANENGTPAQTCSSGFFKAAAEVSEQPPSGHGPVVEECTINGTKYQCVSGNCQIEQGEKK